MVACEDCVFWHCTKDYIQKPSGDNMGECTIALPDWVMSTGNKETPGWSGCDLGKRWSNEG